MTSLESEVVINQNYTDNAARDVATDHCSIPRLPRYVSYIQLGHQASKVITM